MRYLVFIFSLLQPIYALVFSIVEIIKQHSTRLPLISIALAFGTISYVLEPLENLDLYRHYERIVSLRGIPLSSIIENSESGYLVFDTYAWLINFFHLPKQFFPATIVFTAYYLVFSIFNDIKTKNFSNYSYMYTALIFIVFWLSIGFFGLSSGLRNPFANIIVLFFSYHLFFYKKILLFLISSFIAFFIHPFAIVPAILACISYIYSSRSESSKLFVYLGVFFIASNQAVSIIFEKITPYLMDLGFYKDVYFDIGNQIALSSSNNLSLNEFIALKLIPSIPIYVSYIYLLIIKPRENNPLYSLLCLICTCLGFFYSFDTAYNRMSIFFMFVFAIFIAYEGLNKKSKYFSVFLSLYLLSLILYSITSIYTFYPYLITIFPTIFKPLLFIVFDV